MNDSTRGYSVYISDVNNSTGGSGVLFYPGGDILFVFTCAHVVDDLEVIRLHFLKEIDAEKDYYEELISDIPSSQVMVSPLDIITVDKGGDKLHSEDLAIIKSRKPAELELEKTRFFITETRRNDSVFVQGYASGVPTGKKLITYLDALHGKVVVNPPGDNQFTIRLDDTFLDSGNRVSELEGLSGAPVWADDEELNGLLGIFTSAYGLNATLGKTHATKAQQLRSIMKERYGIVIERKLEGIPEEDVAGTYGYEPVVFDGTINDSIKEDNEKWIEAELSALRIIIDDLKLQRAIDKGRDLIEDSRYQYLSIDSKRKVKQYLLYCYEIADLDDDFEALEEEMRQSGLLKGHDTLRWFTRSFMKRDYQETIRAAKQTIDNWDASGRDSVLSFAKLFLLMARAYTEELPVEEVMGQLLDNHECFVLPLDKVEDAGLAYQIIGYVYGERYKDYVNSVRFLNRSYRIGYDSIILESLGASYYFLSIKDATDKSDKIVDTKLIDRKALYKARECFLNVIRKADKLFWAGTMRRVGMCVFNTFVFLPDNYRILSVYPDVKKYVKPGVNIDENEFWRDVELKCARVVAQSGKIRLIEYPHLKRIDRLLLDAIVRTTECSNIIEQAVLEYRSDEIPMIGLDKYIKDVIKELENDARIIDKSQRTSIYIQLMNLYGRGIHLFKWNKREKLDYYFERIKGNVNPEMVEFLENFLYEFDAPIEDVIKRFKATFEKNRNLSSWQELNRLYIRHGLMDKADEMYTELITSRKELISDEPEYAYRAVIDYVTLHKRNLKIALQSYIKAKEAFCDTDIEGFWELELMVCTNSFNEPERFENERKPFLEKGLITEEQYHRTAFIAYVANLNEEKARNHYEYVKSYPHYINPQTGTLIAHQSEIHFLNWIGDIAPRFKPPYYCMSERRAFEVRKKYKNERWHRALDKQLANQLRIDRTVAVDAWGLYQLVVL